MADTNPTPAEDGQEEEQIDPIVKAPELYKAVKENNVSAALSLLSQDVPPVHLDESAGHTCLYWAVKNANSKLAKLIIEKGGSSHYHHAKKLKQLDPSADVQEELSHKLLLNSPLLLAAHNGYVNMTWMLLVDGFSPDDVDELGNSSVHLAAAGGHDKCLNLLVADGAEISMFNKFRNTPLDISITKETHDLLVSERDRRQGNNSFDSSLAHADLIRKHARLSGDLINAISEASRNNSSFSPDELDAALVSAIENAENWSIDDDMTEEGKVVLAKLRLTNALNKACGDIVALCPIRKQSVYIQHVTNLEKMIEKAEASGVDRSGLQYARDLVVRCQIEYWLSTSVDRLKDVEQADESHEHDTLRLKACIQKAEALGASETLIDEAALRLLRLETEIEMSRALATFQKERLPIENPPADYWQPCDIGRIYETEEFPLPPESGEYIWEPSAAYTRLKTSIDRLKKCLVGIENAQVNETIVAEVKDKLLKSEKDFKLLDAKDAEDKRKAVESATKAAKKLKKAKKSASAKK